MTTDKSKRMTDQQLNDIEAGIDSLDYAGTLDQVHLLIDEIRRLNAVLDQVDAMTKRIDRKLDRLVRKQTGSAALIPGVTGATRP